MPADSLNRLTKLLPLLGSDKAGEIVAAALAIGRALHGAGCDWHDVAAACSRGWNSPAAETSAPALHEWQRVARACILANSGTLSAAEMDFLHNIAARHTEPSERQWVWLDAIAAALKVRCAA